MVLLLRLWRHLERFVEGERVDFLQDCLQGDQRLLQDFVPVIFGQVDNDWYKHWESLLLVGLQDVEEVVIFEEAHGSVSDLQVDAANALDDPLEQLRNQMLNFVDLAHLEHLLQLRQEQRLLDAVGEGPELEQAFQERYRQRSILRQEQHRATK